MAADAKEHGYPDRLSSALIGSCTNSSYEDLERAADVARQARAHGVRAKTMLWVTPGSEQIHQTIRATDSSRTSRRSAPPCSRTPAAPASASGSATT